MNTSQPTMSLRRYVVGFTSTRLSLIALGVAVAAASILIASVADAQRPFPTLPPPAAPLNAPEFPPFQEARLSNGLQLVLVERHTQPILSVSLAMPAGSSYDPAGKEGLADMVAGLLTKGAGDRGAEQIAATIEGVGGTLGAGAGADFITVRTDVLSPNAPLAFSLLSDVVRRPTFPVAEVELARTQTLSGLQLQLSQPASLASRFFAQNVYGSHPYSRSATPESVRGLSREDLVAYQRSRLTPEGSLLVIAGDIKLDEAKKLAEQAFSDWTGSAPDITEVVAPPARKPAEIVLVHRPGSVQSNIIVGNIAFGPADPNRYATTVATRILGGGADSRLFTILREEKGWTYGAYSNVTQPRGPGVFQATAEVRTAVTDSALTELLAQLRLLRSQPVSDVELEAAKGSLVGSFPLTIETAQQIAGAVLQVRVLGLGTDYLQQYRNRLAAVTQADVQTAARAAMHPDSALIVVVGDGAKLYEPLRKIAPVRIIDLNGALLTADDLVAKPPSVTLDPRRLLAGVDSFAVLLQGREFGFQRSEVKPDADGGYTLVESSQLGPVASQTTTLKLDAKLNVRSVDQKGTMQGQATSIAVSYSGGRAIGKASVARPPAGAVAPVAIDADVPTGVIDDNALLLLVPTMPWTASARFTLPVFASAQGKLETYTLAVAGSEEVTVPAGTFKAYKVEVTGGSQPMTLYVSQDAPHRLLKMTIAGAPVEVVRVR